MTRVRDFFRLLNQPCRDMTGLLSRSMDGDLPFSERFAYKFHLLYCTACRRYIRQLRLMRDALRRVVDRLAEIDGIPGARLSSNARKRIARVLRDR
jgi:anti-sigma factor RsiW